MGHLEALRSSAKHNGLDIDYRALIDPSVDSGLPGGNELIALARSAASPTPDPETLRDVALILSDAAAVDALEVAGGFAMVNRMVEATGIPVLTTQRDRMMPLIRGLGIDRFPHSGVTTHAKRLNKIRKVIRRLTA